jgi:hypothetical protein
VLHKNKKVQKRRRLEGDARVRRDKAPEMEKPRRVTPHSLALERRRGRLFKGSTALKSRTERNDLLALSFHPTSGEQSVLEREPAL